MKLEIDTENWGENMECATAQKALDEISRAIGRETNADNVLCVRLKIIKADMHDSTGAAVKL